LKIEIYLLTDGKPEENKLQILKQNSENRFRIFKTWREFIPNAEQYIPYCLVATECYRFRIQDSGGNGIIGGFYRVFINGELLVENFDFNNDKKAHNFNCDNSRYGVPFLPRSVQRPQYY